MAKFASASKQAASVMKQLQGNIIKSVGTVRDYESSLRVAAQWAKNNQIKGGLRGMSPNDANRFLSERAERVGEKTVDQNRQALQAMMHFITGKLPLNERLNTHIKGIPAKLESRTYTSAQVKIIASFQTERNSLATEIAYSAGLRAAELITLRPINERATSDRPALREKFSGLKQSVAYSVQGKGGLIREIRLPIALASKLEEKRLKEPILVKDRGIYREKFYDIGGGNAWSKSFTIASQKAFGWSNGAHGLRHSYAQNRMLSLKHQGFSDSHAKETVSQEVGHFRPDITETYLR